jgi:hypothetical protein
MAKLDKLDIQIKKYFTDNLDSEYKNVFVKMKFHIPGTDKYNFYAAGSYKNYIQSKKVHKPREEQILKSDGSYVSMSEYMGVHQTKETDENVKIHIYAFNQSETGKIAKDSIIFDSVISLCEEHTKKIGLDKNKERITDYYFNQFIKSHKFKKED